MKPDTLRRLSRASVSFVFVTVLLDMMGVGLAVPVLPTLVGTFTQNVQSQSYWYGALLFTFGATQFLCAPLLGALSDRFGRRVVLLMSIAGLGLMFLVCGLAQSLVQLLLARVLGGALAANVSVANAYVADITTAEDRAKSFGRLGAAFGLGFIVGPMIGGFVGGYGIRYPFFVAAALAFLNFGYGLFVLPESLPADRRKPISFARANPFGALRGLFRLAGVGPLVAVMALVGLAQFILISTWVLFNTFRHGWGPRENGLSFFAVGLASAVVQGGLLGMLVRKFGERRVVVAGIVSSMFAYVGYGVSTHGWMVYVVMMMNLLGFGVASAMNALVSKAAPANEQGIAMGSVSSLNSLVAVTAPLLGIPLFAHVSRFPRDDVRVGATFFLSALLSATALAIALWHFARERRAE